MSLFNSIRSAAGALQAFDRALTVVQSNVSNSSTAGYARQVQNMVSLPFDPAQGLSGGVRPLPVTDSRNSYAEQSVWRQAEALGRFDQMAASLEPIETGFDLSGDGGVAAAMNRLLQKFSAWSVSPNDTTARQGVIDSAQEMAQSFQSAYNTLVQHSADMDSQIEGTVDRINELATVVRDYNVGRQLSWRSDPAMESTLYASLEELSGLANVTARQEGDGSYTLLLAGQTPLVIGANQYRVDAQFAVPADATYTGAPPNATVVSSSGTDITGGITQGKLGGLLEVRNGTLAHLMGSGEQPGELNRLASAFASRINEVLEDGQVSEGPPPVWGTPLFAIDAAPERAAVSLAVHPDITAANLAAIKAGPPAVSNGTALDLAGLGNPKTDADKIDGTGFMQFYGGMAAGVGRDLSESRNRAAIQKQLVLQAQDLRNEISGVSLDEEAVTVLEYQRAYQASAQMLSVLNDLTDTLVRLID